MATLTREDVIRLLQQAETPANLNLNHRRFEAGINLTGLDLHRASLVGARLVDANLAGVNLSGANLRSAWLMGANLNGAILKGVNFGKNFLAGLEPYGALYYFFVVIGLIVGVFPGLLIIVAMNSRRQGALLTGASLRGVDLAGCNLRGFNLRSANLSGANLGFADLRYTDLRNANLSQANLEGTNISEAKMSDTQATSSASGVSLQQVFGYWGTPIGQPRNSMAIAGFVLGIMGVLTSWLVLGILFCIPGMILSAVGMRRRGDRRKAITGLILSILGVVIAVTILVLANPSK